MPLELLRVLWREEKVSLDNEDFLFLFEYSYNRTGESYWSEAAFYGCAVLFLLVLLIFKILYFDADPTGSAENRRNV